MVKISFVEPESIGDELGLEAGDSLVSINGAPLKDLLDYYLMVGQEEIVLLVRKEDGELWELDIEKDAPDTMGIELEHPEPTQCGNNCIFCFVHQLPRGMRRTLYVKDEDYRYSYLYGSYVTLTNIGEKEIERIIDRNISPLYVSVHATDDQLRAHLLGREAPSILDLLRRLADAGIEIHTQIVLCPGINDGVQLEKTITDLYALFPAVRSLAVVPVGLTGYRDRLPDLRPPSPEEAAKVIETISRFASRCLDESGVRFVYAADEFYLKAGIDFPSLEEYDDLSQLENGVGMIPLFRADAQDLFDEAVPLDVPAVSTFTGASFFPELDRFLGVLEEKTGAVVHRYRVDNDFFAGHVTVTGLLTGRDVIAALRRASLGDCLLIPDVVLKEGEDVFLDDVSLQELETELGVRVLKIKSSPWGILEALETLADE